jgi:hypothetical protein
MNMQEPTIKTKSKKRYFSIIFWLSTIILAYFLAQYFLNQDPQNVAISVAKIEIETKPEVNKVETFAESAKEIIEKPLDKNEILLKQQMQISELQNGLNDLRLNLNKLKTSESLSKIILSFVRLRDLVDLKQNYDEELKKLAVLCRADFVISGHIEKLKLALQYQPKNNQELSQNFINLAPQIKAKKIEIKNGESVHGRFKAAISKVFVIRKSGENIGSDIALLSIENQIKNRKYGQAIQNIELIGGEYQEIFTILKVDLRKADDFQQVSDEIYKYLETLSSI